MERDVKQRLQDQPLRREAVQRRQPRDRHAADQERAARPRHPPEQPAEVIEIEAAGGPLQRTRTEEQQGLEDGVVGDMQQRRRKRDRGPRGVAGLGEQQRRAEAERDDADILDRAVGQQPLQLMLDERPQDPAER